jgi:hypothetical protein
MNKAKISGYFFYLMRSIISKHGFKLDGGTIQLGAKTAREKELVEKAIEFGRMQAFEQVGRMVDESSDAILNFDEQAGKSAK